jgi:prepilin-type N-terminal cleavage/methylation domain-containing protein
MSLELRVKKTDSLNIELFILNSRRAGFTLVELAIVLVIVGLLIGMGAGLIGPLTKRAKLIETRNTVKEVYETIYGYAAANKRLPPVPPGLSALSVKTMDSYRNSLLYYPATGLTASNLCTTQGTYLTVNDIGAAKINVAFVILSRGENLCDQTGTASPFNIYDVSVPTVCIGGGGIRGYDDIVMYVDISTLRQQICNTFKVVTDSLPSGTEEVAYSLTNLSATDGTPAYTWSVFGQTQGTNGCAGTNYPIASVNTGLCLSTGGIISGTPILDGSYTFIVSVTDAEARPATKTLSITINPNDPKITTEFLTYGKVTQVYPSTTMSATGGRSAYTWCVCQNVPLCTVCNTGVGRLPAGLTLNAGGIISGTPTTAGVYSFTVRATDSAVPARTTSKTLSIAVNP